MASLIAIEGSNAGKRFPLEDECVIGRSFNCQICVGELSVSRRHARIRVEGKVYVVEDLGSGNGTFVNERRISQHRLSRDDVLRIGSSSFRYEADDASDGGLTNVQTVLAGAIQLGASPLKQLATAPSEHGGLDELPSVEELAAESAESASGLASLPESRTAAMLEAMFAVADVLAAELTLESLLNKVLDHLFGLFPLVQKGFILLENPATGELIPEAVKQRATARGGGLSVSQTMIAEVMEQREGVIRHSTAPPSAGSSDDARGGKIPRMGAPLMCQGKSLGTVLLEGTPGGTSFSTEELMLLAAVARQVAMAIANARAGQSLVAQQRMEDDLKFAQQIQRSFLPQKLPVVPGASFQTHYLPALSVGGDFYDIIQLDDQRLGILVGDISGKGMSAALVMAKVASDIRLFSQLSRSPGEILTRANEALLSSGQDIMFATVGYLLLDLEQHTLTLANAGHQPPLVASKHFTGLAELVDPRAVALGVMPGVTYTEQAYAIEPGSVVVLYTDGINEALNRQGEEYGMDRLNAIVTNGPIDASLIVERIVNDVRHFVGGATQSDDQTLVAFGVS